MSGSSAQFVTPDWCDVEAGTIQPPNTDLGNPGVANTSCTASTLDIDGDGFCPGGLDNNNDGDCADGAAEASVTQFDCDDTDPLDNTSGIETCNADDEDCDSVLDNGFDDDSDGVTTCGPDGLPATTFDNDCLDTGTYAASVNPNQAEACDGFDTDCSTGTSARPGWMQLARSTSTATCTSPASTSLAPASATASPTPPWRTASTSRRAPTPTRTA